MKMDLNAPEGDDGLRLAGALRTLLRYHQQMGIEQYPLSPALHRFLAANDPGGRQALPHDHGQRAAEAMPPERGRRAAGANAPARAEAVRPQQPGEAGAALQALGQEIDNCRRCPLATARQGLVQGSGAADAALLVVGDYSAQGAEFAATTLFGAAEDALLWNMMRAIGLSPEQVYVTNAVKCCPLPATVPGDDSIRCCRDYLLREIELVRPRVVCAMGEIAARALLDTRETLVRMRGRFHAGRQGNPAGEPPQVMPTFHPRFLLNNVELKKAAWQDLQLVRRQLQAP